jgi:hypothetical protein
MQSTTMRRTSARTAVAVVLAIVGTLALGGAWTAASADPGNGNGGANTTPGPYDDNTTTCPGENQGNSQNCNGSEGKADDKNPPGQVGNTHDRGYECDDNKGVGDHRGNPAHTDDCTTTNTIPGSGCTVEPCDFTPGCVTNCGTVTSTPTTPEAEVLGLVEERPASPNAAPQAQVAGTTQLAFTGSTTDVLGFLALALLAFGGAFILLTRKPQEITTA